MRLFNVTERVFNKFAAWKLNWFLQHLILNMRFLIYVFFFLI